MSFYSLIHGSLSQGEAAAPTGATRPEYCTYFNNTSALADSSLTDFEVYSSGGTGEFTLCGWFRYTIINHDDYSGWRDKGFGVHYTGSGANQLATVFIDGGGFQNVVRFESEGNILGDGYDTNNSEMAEGDWFFFAMKKASGVTALEGFIFNEAGSLVTSGQTAVFTNTDSPVIYVGIGHDDLLNTYPTMHSMQNAVGFWDRYFTDSELLEIYNSGDGLSYEHLDAAQKTNLISWWDCDNPSSTTGITDNHGTTTLLPKAYLSQITPTLTKTLIHSTDYIPVPLTPTNFGGYVWTDTSIKLDWSDGYTYATSYKVYQDNVEIADLPVNQFTYTATGLTSGTTYLFKVAGYNVNGTGTTANISRTLESTAAPINLTGITFNDYVSLNWDNVAPYEEEIRVYVDDVLTATLATGDSSEPITGLTSGTTYEFKVSSFISGLTESFSDVWSGTTTSTTGATGQRPANAAYFNSAGRMRYAVPSLTTGIRSVAYWAKFDNYNNNEIVHLGVTSSGEISTMNNAAGGTIENRTFSNNYTTATSFVHSTWYFFCMTTNNDSTPSYLYCYDESGLIEKLTLTNGAATYFDGQTAFVLGGRTGSPSFGRGSLNAVGMWNKELSSTEVANLWNGGSGLSYSNLVGFGLNTDLYDWWDLDSSTTSDHLSDAGTTTGTITYAPI